MSQAIKPISENQAIATPVWDRDFPRVIVHVPMTELHRAMEDIEPGRKSDLYIAAKSGDARAADIVVKRIVRDELIREISKRFSDAIFLPVYAEEASGRNKLAIAYARRIIALARVEANFEIVQSNIVRHTGANARQRLLRVPTFDGIVRTGRRYVLLDDVVGSGSTLRVLKNYIELRGGIVAMTSTLTFVPGYEDQDSSQLTITQRTLSGLQNSFDEPAVNDILREYGIAASIRHLTDAEGRALLGYKTIDAFRSAVASTRRV